MKSKNKTAISLIVLVITILVLSILAATVIISLSNTNIMGQASSTVFKSDMANYKEAYEMYVTSKLAENSAFDRSTLNITYEDDEYEKIFGSVPDKYKEGLKVVNGKLVYETEDTTEKEIVKDLAMTKESIVKEYVGGVPIPSGFYYVGGTKDTGLVISDDVADVTNGLTGDTAGNQFVWVPVEYTKTGTTTSHTIYSGTTKERIVTLYNSFTNKFKTGALNTNVTPHQMTGELSASYTEPYDGYQNEVDEYYEMMESVQEYRGFYIARFEAGDATGDRMYQSEVGIVVSKKDMPVYNLVPWGEAMDDIGTEGAVYLSKQMYTNHESVVSTLCYGVQWDATMNFVSDNDTHNISDSSEWGNYLTAGINNTGYSEDWKAKNIYDLAGNVCEWTMEAYSSNTRVYRGGYYDDDIIDYTASQRSTFWYLRDKQCEVGFRPTLYIVVE